MFAIVVLLAVAFWSSPGPARLLAACYAGLMGPSLVYLGEHSVIDLVVGGVIAFYS